MHKLINGNVPKPLLNLYKLNKDTIVYFTRQAHQSILEEEIPSLCIELLLFSVFIWNRIIPNIDINVSFTRFIY